MFLGIEAGLERREVVGRLAGRQDEVLLPDPATPLPVVGRHLSDHRRHLGFLGFTWRNKGTATVRSALRHRKAGTL